MEKMIYALLSVKKESDRLDSMLIGMQGISGANLYSLPVDEITAVVSDTTRAGLITDSTNAITFAGVIEALSQEFTLLPMRFGSLMESTGAILKMLERNYPDVQQNLQQVEDMLEFGLKVFCDSEKLRADLMEKSEIGTKTTVLSTPEVKNSVYRDWVNKKLKEHRLEELLLTHVDSVVAAITEHLSRMNAVCKFKKMLTETTIIDALFLLKKDMKTELMQAVGNLQKQYPGLNFVMTGPWPPYNFVEITIK
ncbi:MAG: GvpL/GvpF family gas vesicle protein [Bacteroidia bacterium]|nr:GvpL/GvpF family gas vesicle protein [Bacteroidia bacterium]